MHPVPVSTGKQVLLLEGGQQFQLLLQVREQPLAGFDRVSDVARSFSKSSFALSGALG